MNFAKVQEQGFIPLYKRDSITDDLHEISGFRTDHQFITKRQNRKQFKKTAKEGYNTKLCEHNKNR